MNYDKATRAELVARIQELEAMALGPQHDLDWLPIHLTPTQRALLAILYDKHPRFVPSDYFIDVIGGGKLEWYTTFKTQLSYLRSKLRQLGVSVIFTPGRGYRIPPADILLLRNIISASKVQGIPDSARAVCTTRVDRSSPLNKETIT
jgi:DNA-binding winged helix-turn-helix (wHTH) protein